MKKSPKAPATAKVPKAPKGYSEDHLGVPIFEEETDPINKLLSYMQGHQEMRDDHPMVKAVAFLHDHLEIARSFAVAMYGRHWHEHVDEIYLRYLEVVAGEERVAKQAVKPA